MSTATWSSTTVASTPPLLDVICMYAASTDASYVTFIVPVSVSHYHGGHNRRSGAPAGTQRGRAGGHSATLVRLCEGQPFPSFLCGLHIAMAIPVHIAFPEHFLAPQPGRAGRMICPFEDCIKNLGLRGAAHRHGSAGVGGELEHTGPGVGLSQAARYGMQCEGRLLPPVR